MGQIGTWDKLRLHPTTLVKMVVQGTATIIGKDKHGRYIYSLTSEKRPPRNDMKRIIKRLWFRLRFAWYLWRDVKYDGLGNKIQWWYALPWAWDLKWWGLDEYPEECPIFSQNRGETASTL